MGGRHAVCCHANDVFVAEVRRLVECQGRLTGQNSDFSLLGDKLPREDVRHGSVEGDFDSLRRSDGDKASGEVFAFVAAQAIGADRCASPASGLAYLQPN